MDMVCTFQDNTTKLTDINTESCQYPDLLLGGDGALYACWQSYSQKHDRIFACVLRDGKPFARLQVSGSGQAFKPVLFELRGRIHVAWSEFSGGRWKLMARAYAPEGLGEAVVIGESAGVFFPRAAVDGETAYLAWTQQQQGESRILLCSFDGERAGKPLEVSRGSHCYRPALAVWDGKLCCAYDCFEDGQYFVRALTVEGGAPGRELTLSEGTTWACAPELAVTSSGLTALWYAIAPRADIDYWTAELGMEGGALCRKSAARLARIRDWFASVALASNGRRDILVHSKSYHAMVARSRQDGDAWSNSVIIYCDAHLCAGVRPRIVVTPDDMVYIIYQYANGNGHRERYADVRLFRASFAEIASRDDGYVDALTNNFTRPIEVPKLLEAVDAEEKRGWLSRNGYLGLDLLFGDIHGQSDMSDGSGQIDLYYNYARTVSKLDFTALTDHDCFTDVITESEWEYMRTTCNEFNRDGEFSTLLAYEWTSNEVRYDFGHKNVYYPGGEGEIFRACEKEGLTPDRLFANVKKYGGIAIPHHPAATWEVVSAATDWDFHDPEVQRLAEIFSRHAPFEKKGTTSIYTKNNPRLDGKYVQDALAKGYRLGFTAGSDSHQMEHGTEGGIVAAFVPAQRREDIFAALYNRFVYATTGARILVSLKINGARMGSEISVCAGGRLRVEIDVLGTRALRSVELVQDNEDVFSPACEGRACRCEQELTLAKGSCFYLRVTQQDEHQAWSSPIWVDVIG